MIDLQEFITEALVQIAQGVKNAQTKAAETGAMINPNEFVIQPSGQLHWSEGGYGGAAQVGQLVEFDVAVTAVDKGSLKGGIGVVGGVLNIGYKAEKGEENSSISHLKFTVPVFLPQQQVEIKPIPEGY
jgi:hypothetical protein